MMRMRGANQAALVEDLRAAVEGFVELANGEPERWTKGPRNKWTVGQHAEHVAIALGITADALEENEKRLRDGTLRRRPLRGPLQMLWVVVAIGAGRFPRGGRAPRNLRPASHPDRRVTMSLIARDVERHVALGERLSIEERDRLWIPNPFLKGWHYTYPEILRLHAVHFRHHAARVEEALESSQPEERRS